MIGWRASLPSGWALMEMMRPLPNCPETMAGVSIIKATAVNVGEMRMSWAIYFSCAGSRMTCFTDVRFQV